MYGIPGTQRGSVAQTCGWSGSDRSVGVPFSQSCQVEVEGNMTGSELVDQTRVTPVHITKALQGYGFT